MDTSDITPKYVQAGAAQTFVEAEFGGAVTETEESFSLSSNSVTKVLDDNPERLSIVFVNLGTTTLYISFSDSVSITKGILLAQNGGAVTVNIRDDQMLTTRAWWSFAGTLGGTLYVLTTYRYNLT